MANASTDENTGKTLIAALDSDGLTIVKVLANPTTHTLAVADNTTGSDHGPTFALTDDNGVKTLFAASSADGITPVAVYADSNGNLLIDSN